ncbi:MAG TPA: PAS domain S-box protein [Thermoanaerobaculia bacterium]|nr:PAS domain S-box protein [Thermoanaerobaculia bacterium]
MRIPLVDQVISLVRKPATPSRRASSREDRVRAALTAAPVGIAVATLDGTWLFVNDRFRTLVGYGREELARISFNSITHPDDAKKELPLMKRLLSADLPSYRIEKRLMGKNGRYRALDVVTAIAHDVDVLVYVVDEAAPPQHAPRRAEADRVFATVIDQLADVAVIRTDDRGLITGWNAGAQRLFGYTRDEILGRNRRTLYRDADSWDGKSTAVLQHATNERVEMEDWRVTREGAHVWIRSALSSWKPDGVVRGYIETITAPPAPKPPDTAPFIERLQAEVEKKTRIEESLRDLIDDLRRTSEETMTELRIMTAALRDEIDRRKSAEEALRLANERLAQRVIPSAVEGSPASARDSSPIGGFLDFARDDRDAEEVLLAAPPSREWRSLSETRVVGILREHAFHARCGTLLVRSAGKEKEIFFEEGKIFSCASNDPEKFLTNRLLAKGAISEEQRLIANEIKQASQLALGRILMILGAISEEQLVDAMRSKMRDEIAELLTWTEGEYVFIEGDVPSLQLVPLRVDVEAILEAAIEPPPVFIASAKSRKVHQPTCVSARRLTGAMRIEVSNTDGFEPCRLCFPR